MTTPATRVPHGGQLVKGDCITSTAKEIACASAGSDAFKVLALVEDKKECPAATTEPMQLMMAMVSRTT